MGKAGKKLKGGGPRANLHRLSLTPPLQLSPTRGRGFPALLSSQCFQLPRRHPRARPGDPRLGNDAGRKTWVAGPSLAMTARGVERLVSKSDVEQPALWGPEPFGLRALWGDRGWREGQPGSMMHGVMEEPGGRFAHGFFRRTGGAGSVTAPGGNRNVSGGLGPIPIQQHTAWASRHRHLRTATCTGPCLLPHCDASRARPSSGADLAQGYRQDWDHCQEQSENITLPVLPLCPHPPTVMACLVPAMTVEGPPSRFTLEMIGLYPDHARIEDPSPMAMTVAGLAVWCGSRSCPARPDGLARSLARTTVRTTASSASIGGAPTARFTSSEAYNLKWLFAIMCL